MRKACSVAVTIAIALCSISTAYGRQIDRVQVGGIKGTATDAQKQNLAGVKVQLRDSKGQLAGAGVTDAAGQFTFGSLPPGTYTVEVLDLAGNLVGIAPVTVVAGAVVNVNVTGAAAGAIAGAKGGGLSLFGLGTIGTVAVIGGAAAVTTAAIVATKDGKIVLCHKEAGKSAQTITVDESARDSHMAHGDTLGACPASPSR